VKQSETLIRQNCKVKVGKGLPSRKIYRDLANLGDRALGYSQWLSSNHWKSRNGRNHPLFYMACKLTPPALDFTNIYQIIFNPRVLENGPKLATCQNWDLSHFTW